MDNFAEDFYPCKRFPYPGANPLIDLSTNRELAEAVYDIVHKLLWMRDKHISYSGFARPVEQVDDPLATLYAQVWLDGNLYRSIAFRNVGYVGVLHMEMDGETAQYVGLGRDMIGNAYHSAFGLPNAQMAVVNGERLWVSYEIRQ